MTAIASVPRRWLLSGLAALCVSPQVAAASDSFDPARSRFGFELKTRWGMKLEGVFPRYEGGVKHLDDGRHQVHLRMFSQFVQIEDNARYDGWTRSDKFFWAERYPEVVFVSQPYSEDLLRTGGPLAGELSIRGVTRTRTLNVAPATCARPAQECDVVATGAVRRSDFRMDDWQVALGDRVVFVLKARLKPDVAP